MPSLDWIGRKAVENHHNEVPFHLLRYESKLSAGDAESGNLLIQGDNLLALKALLPYYAGQVKCIYIDPPYNTGNENWVYNDNVNSPQIREWLGKVVGSEGEDLSRHDKWLCMMYPRLKLLRQMLREDGAIFASIDDGAVGYLRCVMDEIFGTQNFIASIIWQKKQSPQNDAINLSDMHDYILVYARRAKTNRNDPLGWQRQLLTRTGEQDRRYSNPDNDSRGDWTSVDYTCNKSADERPNLYYPIINPNTGEEIWPSRKAVWRFEKSSHEQNVAESRVWWGVTGTSRPRLKKFRLDLASGIVPSTWWDKEFAGTNQEARKEIRALFGADETDFSTPKPTRLIKRILQLATSPGDLVLDSFAGSGTTGHAVLQIGGNRRFILVEMEPTIAQSITAERLKRVIQGYGNTEGLGGGYRFCTLGPTLFDSEGRIRAEVAFDELARHVFFVETGEPLPSEIPEAQRRGKRANGKSPLLGVSRGTAVYLLYNGILKDKSPNGGNALTRAVLANLPPHNGPKVIYGTSCRVGPERLRSENITFKQIPYAIKVA
jgi:adenine-specific DNA-methyltransferase